MHMLRLGYQGKELLETERISLPIREPERAAPSKSYARAYLM